MYYSLVKEVQEYETKILGMGTWVKDKLTSAAGKIVWELFFFHLHGFFASHLFYRINLYLCFRLKKYFID